MNGAGDCLDKCLLRKDMSDRRTFSAGTFQCNLPGNPTMRCLLAVCKTATYGLKQISLAFIKMLQKS